MHLILGAQQPEETNHTPCRPRRKAPGRRPHSQKHSCCKQEEWHPRRGEGMHHGGKHAFPPGVHLLDKVVAMPVGVQHNGFVEVPQLQFLDKVLTTAAMAVGTGISAVLTPFFALRQFMLTLSFIFRSPRWCRVLCPRFSRLRNNHDNHDNPSRSPQECPFCCLCHLSKQRCWRRNGSRSFLRHERLSVAMALAESQHHTSRGQKMARAGEGDLEMHYTATFRTHPPPQAPCTVQWTWMTCPAAGGSRPDRLSDVGPQERVQRRTVEQTIDAVPSLPTLDVLARDGGGPHLH